MCCGRARPSVDGRVGAGDGGASTPWTGALDRRTRGALRAILPRPLPSCSPTARAIVCHHFFARAARVLVPSPALMKRTTIALLTCATWLLAARPARAQDPGRERLLMDFGWRFRPGRVGDVDHDGSVKAG